MKTLFFKYLSGLYRLYRRNKDADIYVMIILILIESILILSFLSILNYPLPYSEKFGNKWIIRLVTGLIFWTINRYLFGIRESVYSKYQPLSKSTTLLITFLYFFVTIGYLLFWSKM